MKARNIRLDSLSSNRQVANQGEPPRRIKCDRSLPTCVKCASRDLECPGYQAVPLKWGQGLASRGKFAGKSVPVINKHRSKGKKKTFPSARQEKEDAPLSNQQDKVPSPLEEPNPEPISITTPHPSQDLQLVNSISSTTLSDNLLQHFCTRVIPRLTWIDLPGSPWRDRILPLAQRSTCLRLALSGLATAHLHTTSIENNDQTSRLLQMRLWLRDASLRIVNRKMQLAMQPDPNTIRPRNNQSLIEILTAMVILCYTEAFIPGSRDWTLHLRGCRTLIDFGDLERSASRTDIESFILKEVADLNTLCNISVFNDEPKSLAEPLGNTRIWSFTGLVNDITTIERQRHDARQKGQQPEDLDMDEWHRRAQRSCTEVTARATFSEDQEAMRDCFQAVVRAHYHATIIYSYQAFASASEVQNLVNSSIDTLLCDIQYVLAGHIQTFSHDLFLPCFLAGTECRRDKLRQSIIEKLFLDSLSMTGLWCNHTALQFLRTLWASPEYESGMNWIQYARENEARIGTFIAF
ncbi:hypothetical protein NM208_g595 [Fusarium decemcellulare]|uniref:Uncharacterized protein n=1 Tax=Fusarium decemcellulare TaxID=57161 RepID=A0ACC1SZ43_9HYPO|nr:hypothetical protein NM208_g595 [Fusarium decemcellulare]